MASLAASFSREALEIVALSVIASAAIELLCYLFVWRTASYKRMMEDLEWSTKKSEELKEKHKGQDKKGKEVKKQKKLDGAVKGSMRDMFVSKMKVGAINLIILIALFRWVGYHYKGVVVARLPFEPPQLMHRITHANLEGTNYTDCSAMFIYVLCQMSVR